MGRPLRIVVHGQRRPPGLAADFANAIRDIPRDRALTVLCSIFQSDHRDDVRRLDKPTLLVYARDDIAAPESVARYLQRAIKDSRLVMIDAQGHLPHISAPTQVLAAIRDFIRGRDAVPPPHDK